MTLALAVKRLDDLFSAIMVVVDVTVLGDGEVRRWMAGS